MEYNIHNIKDKLQYIINKYCISDLEEYKYKSILYTLEEGILEEKLIDLVRFFDEEVFTKEDEKEIIKFIIEQNAKQDLRLIAQELIRQQTEDEQKLYNKEDIMNIFSCESDKALRILRLSHQMKYATKIGKEYYISKLDFKTFIDQIKGRNTII
jgi:Asp-tRNA(Asn)/Glu-tRNA(Gln) amidotransferase B subunit